jgi:hypothetical protein
MDDDDGVPPVRMLPPFLALLALWLLFELPTALRPTGIDLRGLRPTVDFLAIVTAYALLRGRPAERSLRRVWRVLLWGLIAVRIDWTICWLITRSRPLFYDQLFLVRHLVVLVSDLWSLSTALFLVTVTLAVWGTVALARALSRVARALFEPPLRRSCFHVLGAAWCAIAVLALFGKRADAKEPPVRLVLPELVANVRESYRTYRSVQRGIVDTPYAEYSAIQLARRPNVTFFFIESYGRIISDSPDLAARLAPHLHGMERALASDGWHMVSAFSAAPVSGGRSWLAVGSIFMGAPLPYEAVFRHFLNATPAVPSIPAFFAANGYDTIALEPSDRARPGVEEANYYHVARQIHFDQLNYTGKTIGWGLVPDQYSLAFAEQSVLGASTRPRFFMFHMVSSHMPWSVVPEITSDWHSLNDAGGAQAENVHDDDLTVLQKVDRVSGRLKRYGREEMQRWVKYGGLGPGFRERYVDTVAYDLMLIEQHLLREHADELVVVMGDHQPPAVAPDGANFDVPVHVFARDPALLAEFVDRGFSPGLIIDPKASPALEHAAIFSLLVRDLVRLQPSSGSLPPPYLSHGMPLAG